MLRVLRVRRDDGKAFTRRRQPAEPRRGLGLERDLLTGWEAERRRVQTKSGAPSGTPDLEECPTNYWIGAAGAPNGSAGAAAAFTCQIVLPALTANDRVPVDPKVCGTAVA